MKQITHSVAPCIIHLFSFRVVLLRTRRHSYYVFCARLSHAANPPRGTASPPTDESSIFTSYLHVTGTYIYVIIIIMLYRYCNYYRRNKREYNYDYGPLRWFDVGEESVHITIITFNNNIVIITLRNWNGLRHVYLFFSRSSRDGRPISRAL